MNHLNRKNIYCKAQRVKKNLARSFCFRLCLLFFFQLCLTIQGCQTTPVYRDQLENDVLLKKLIADSQEIQTWSFRGKMGIKTEDTAQSVQLLWKQNGRDFEIILTAPLGAGSAKIEGSDAFLVMYEGKKTHYAETPEALFSKLFGWEVPISNIFWWIKGSPTPNFPTEDIIWNEKGQLEKFSQQEWHIELSNYKQLPTQQKLNSQTFNSQKQFPHKIIVEQADKKLTLIVQDWQVD